MPTIICDKSTWNCKYTYICITESLKSTENAKWCDVMWHRGFIIIHSAQATSCQLTLSAYPKFVPFLQPRTLPPKMENYPLTTYAPSHISGNCFICCVMQKICKCVCSDMTSHALNSWWITIWSHCICFRKHVLRMSQSFPQFWVVCWNAGCFCRYKVSCTGFWGTEKLCSEIKPNQTDEKSTLYL